MKDKLTDEKIETIFGVLTRIEAIKDFGEIKKGDKGGFIANEKNLSLTCDCLTSIGGKAGLADSFTFNFMKK